MTPVAAWALAGLLWAQAPAVFPTGVELVHVDVYVTRGGQPVAGLSAEDFAITDNGVAQQVSLVARDAAPTTAILALDSSWSLAGEKLRFVKDAARAFVGGLGADDRAALLSVGHDVVQVAAPTADRAAVEGAIESLSASGFTSLVDAAWVGLKRDWGPGRPVLVLFSDGRDSTSWLENADLLQAATESNVLLYVVAVDPSGAPGAADRRRRRPESGQAYLLRRAAETTGGAYWTARSHAELAASFRLVVEAVNARYLLAYEPRGVARPGRHRLAVSVARPGLEVRARQEYFVADDSRLPATR